MRWLRKIIFIVVGTGALFLLLCNLWVVWSTSARIYEDQSSLPDHQMALVLGTSHRTVGGGPNPYFEKRMETAAELFKYGKVSHFILSGDNRTMYYNEPIEMRKALVGKGVPPTAITLDYAGLRTLDSIIRCKQIFGQDKITIITQPFHSYRALFISSYYDIDAVAMVAGEPDFENSIKVRFREYLARTKAVLDLYVFKTTPRFLGRKEEVKVSGKP
jgi:SanA protein